MNLWFFNETLFTTPTSLPGFSVKLLLRFLQKKPFAHQLQTGNGYWVRLAIFPWIHHGQFFQMKLSSPRRLLLQDRGSSLYSSCPREFNSALLNILSLTEIAAFFAKNVCAPTTNRNGYWVRLAIFPWIHHSHFFK